MNPTIINKITAAYHEKYDNHPVLVKSPGRINLIGEHTDYNEGFVLPAAVTQSIYFAAGRREDQLILLSSLDQKEDFKVELENVKQLVPNQWPNYLLGIVDQLLRLNLPLGGFQLVFAGDIPMGSGMSSSAALENGVVFALNHLFDLGLSKMEMLKISQRAEHQFAGVKCGIMDQFASMMGQENKVIKLDCKTLAFTYHQFDLGDHCLLLLNSNVHHSLASSEYNVRRIECETGVRVLQKSFPNVGSLRDTTIDQLYATKSEMDEVVFSRCKYILEENDRVHNLVNALIANDLSKAGEILSVAQQAMKTEYEITCVEIDFLAEKACELPYVKGSRMMGGGFGGCTINLLLDHKKTEFIETMSHAYQSAFDKKITPIEVRIDGGTCLLA